MYLLDIADVRDLVMVIAGILSIIVNLVLLAIVALILVFGRKGMQAVNGLVDKRLKPALAKVSAIGLKVNARSNLLPGVPGSSSGWLDVFRTARETRDELQDAKPPFRSRKRSWLPFR